MQWLRKFLSRSTERSSKVARPNTFRPSLEALAARDLPSISSVITATGITQFAVDNQNTLLVKSTELGAPVFVAQPGLGAVRTAQGFKTANGGIGVDIVLMDGTWRHIELGAAAPTSAIFLKATAGGATAADFAGAGAPAGSRILDVGTAYDKSGKARVDILFSKPTATDSSLDQTGSLFEFNQASTTGGLTAPGVLTDLSGVLPNVRFVSDYATTNGQTGFAFGQVTGGTPGTPGTLNADGTVTGATAGTGSYLVRKFDFQSSLQVLYSGSEQAGGGITEFTQAVGPTTTLVGPLGLPVVNPTPQVITDITFDADTSTDTNFNPNKTYTLTLNTTPTGTGLTFAAFSLIGTAQTTVKPGG